MIDLKKNLLAALKKTTSATHKSTSQLAGGYLTGARHNATKDALEELHKANIIGHCRITKGGKTNDVWWMIGVTPPTPSSLLSKATQRRMKACEDEDEG